MVFGDMSELFRIFAKKISEWNVTNYLMRGYCNDLEVHKKVFVTQFSKSVKKMGQKKVKNDQKSSRGLLA
jgi:hypothetical protein